MSKKTVVFDFDKTIVSKDTYYEFICWNARKNAVRFLALAIISPMLWLMMRINPLRIIAVNLFSFIGTYGESHRMKSRVPEFLAAYFSKLGAIVYPLALIELEQCQNSGHEILIISGCPDWLLKPVCAHLGLEHCEQVGSRHKMLFNALLYDKYCYGDNKLEMAITLGSNVDTWIAGYSDCFSDWALLSRCQKQTFVDIPYHKQLKFYKQHAGKANCVNFVEWKE